MGGKSRGGLTRPISISLQFRLVEYGQTDQDDIPNNDDQLTNGYRRQLGCGFEFELFGRVELGVEGG